MSDPYYRQQQPYPGHPTSTGVYHPPGQQAAGGWSTPPPPHVPGQPGAGDMPGMRHSTGDAGYPHPHPHPHPPQQQAFVPGQRGAGDFAGAPHMPQQQQYPPPQYQQQQQQQQHYAGQPAPVQGWGVVPPPAAVASGGYVSTPPPHQYHPGMAPPDSWTPVPPPGGWGVAAPDPIAAAMMHTAPPLPQFPRVGRPEPIEEFYTLGEMLGKGAFSEVLNATNKADGKEYAVKIMRKNFGDPNAMQITITELKIFQLLGNYPHVVCMKDIFENDTHWFLVLEKITGGELFQRICELKHYTERDASRLMKQLILGIQYMWAKNIAHRDLKPENLLLSSKELDASLLITDFGLSCILDYPTQPIFHPVGTPGYVAPELVFTLDRGTPYTRAVDMWACGVIMYIMLSGSPPFYGANNNETFNRIKMNQWGFPSPYWDDISDSAKDLIAKMICYDARYRITPDEALEHPWIKDQDAVPDKLLETQVAELRRFNLRRRFRRAVAVVMASNRMRAGLLSRGDPVLVKPKKKSIGARLGEKMPVGMNIKKKREAKKKKEAQAKQLAEEEANKKQAEEEANKKRAIATATDSEESGKHDASQSSSGAPPTAAEKKTIANPIKAVFNLFPKHTGTTSTNLTGKTDESK